MRERGREGERERERERLERLSHYSRLLVHPWALFFRLRKFSSIILLNIFTDSLS
jgi:hypothetical protein